MKQKGFKIVLFQGNRNLNQLRDFIGSIDNWKELELEYIETGSKELDKESEYRY